MIQTIYLAGGCFWGVEAYFKQARGVVGTTVGYCNGNMAFPHYEDLKSGKATHAETVKIDYDDAILSLEHILEMYLRIVDPYSVNRQGHDEGLQYRTGIYYVNPLDGIKAESFLSSRLMPGWKIEIKPMNDFFPAEAYHQDYLDKNPGGYCHIDLRKMTDAERKPDSFSSATSKKAK